MARERTKKRQASAAAELRSKLEAKTRELTETRRQLTKVTRNQETTAKKLSTLRKQRRSGRPVKSAARSAVPEIAANQERLVQQVANLNTALQESGAATAKAEGRVVKQREGARKVRQTGKVRGGPKPGPFGMGWKGAGVAGAGIGTILMMMMGGKGKAEIPPEVAVQLAHRVQHAGGQGGGGNIGKDLKDVARLVSILKALQTMAGSQSTGQDVAPGIEKYMGSGLVA